MTSLAFKVLTKFPMQEELDFPKLESLYEVKAYSPVHSWEEIATVMNCFVQTCYKKEAMNALWGCVRGTLSEETARKILEGIEEDEERLRMVKDFSRFMDESSSEKLANGYGRTTTNPLSYAF